MDADKEIASGTDAVTLKRKKLIAQRISRPAKCAKAMGKIIQLRIDAVLAAKVDLKLPGSATSQLTESIDKENTMNQTEISDSDNEISFSNEPDEEELSSCSFQIENVAEDTETAMYVVLAVSARKLKVFSELVEIAQSQN